MDASAHPYEGVVILHPDMTEENQKQFFRKNDEIIKKFGGEMNHVDTWGKRRLGNAINKVPVGVYFHYTFKAKGDAIAELERLMNINDQVMRFSHLRLDDRVDLKQHVETYKDVLVANLQREKERDAKKKAKSY